MAKYSGLKMEYFTLLSKKSSGLINVYSSPEKNKNCNFGGRFFYLIDIDQNSSINENINEIFKGIELDYTENIKKENADTTAENALESALNNANEKITFLFKNHADIIPIKEINYIIGVLTGNNLVFSCQGKMLAFLMHLHEKRKIAETNNYFAPQNEKSNQDDYKIINIFSNSEKQTGFNPFKLFSETVSGEINQEDYLFFCNENVIEYLSQDKIKKTVLTLPTLSAMEHFKNLLIETNSPFSFCALAASPAAKMKEFDPLTSRPKYDTFSSVNQLLNTESKTEKLLSPSLWPNIRKKTKNAVSLILDKLSKGGEEKTSKNDFVAPNIRKENGRIDGIKNVVLISIKTFANFSVKAFKSLFYLIKIIFTKNKREIKEPVSIKQAKSFMQEEKNKIKASYQSLPKYSKYLALMAFLLVAVFVSSLYLKNLQHQKKTEQEDYVAKIEEIDQMQNKVEIHLVAGLDKEAKKLLNEIDIIIADLPKSSAEQALKTSLLSARNNNFYDRLQHIIKITNPDLLVNFSDFSNEIQPQKTILLNDKVLCLDDQINKIYEYDLSRDEVQIFDLSEYKNGRFIKGIGYRENEALIITDTNLLNSFLPESDSFSSPAINLNSIKRIADISKYENNIYLLDPESNQIFKYGRLSDASFGHRQAWIKDSEINITDASAMAVDGSIWVGKTNGELLHLFKGEKEDFYTSIEPELTNISKIIADANSTDMFIFEANSSRILKLDKSGILKHQFIIEGLNFIKDVSVDYQRNIIIALTDSSLYSFSYIVE